MLLQQAGTIKLNNFFGKKKLGTFISSLDHSAHNSVWGRFL